MRIVIHRCLHLALPGLCIGCHVTVKAIIQDVITFNELRAQVYDCYNLKYKNKKHFSNLCTMELERVLGYK